MRTSVLAVAALTLVALTSPIAAGDKRSSALAVRVTVVRSCSVNTDSGMLTGGTVTCGSRFGPPVRSTSSTITVPLSAAPAARIDASGQIPAPAPRPEQATVAAQPETETAEAMSVRSTAPSTEPESAFEPPGPTAGAPATTMAMRVVTVNF